MTKAAAAEAIAGAGPIDVERRALHELPAADLRPIAMRKSVPEISGGENPSARSRTTRPEALRCSTRRPRSRPPRSPAGAQRALDIRHAHLAEPRRLVRVGIVPLGLRQVHGAGPDL